MYCGKTQAAYTIKNKDRGKHFILKSHPNKSILNKSMNHLMISISKTHCI